MKRIIFQSIPEVLTYALLILSIGLNIIVLSIVITGVRQIERQVSCISVYFNTQGRTGNTTLSSLSDCNMRR